jgi:broad specificity phosphatase PhoE
MPIVNLVFVRHAETSNNNLQMSGAQLTRETRIADVHITPRGHQQSQCLGEYLQDVPNLSLILVSPMLRTLQTAKPLLSKVYHRNIETEVWLDIHEEGGIFTGTRADHLDGNVSSSILHGLTINEIHDHLGFKASIVGEPHPEGWYQGGFETPSECSSRADRVAEKLWSLITAATSASTIVMITHGLFMDSLVRRLMNFMNPRDSHPFFAHNCGLHILHVHSETKHVAVGCLNGTQHLPVDLKTGHSIGDVFKCGAQHFTGF